MSFSRVNHIDVLAYSLIVVLSVYLDLLSIKKEVKLRLVQVDAFRNHFFVFLNLNFEFVQLLPSVNYKILLIL